VQSQPARPAAKAASIWRSNEGAASELSSIVAAGDAAGEREKLLRGQQIKPEHFSHRRV
jgi:hypothetical protein